MDCSRVLPSKVCCCSLDLGLQALVGCLSFLRLAGIICSGFYGPFLYLVLSIGILYIGDSARLLNPLLARLRLKSYHQQISSHNSIYYKKYHHTIPSFTKNIITQFHLLQNDVQSHFFHTSRFPPCVFPLLESGGWQACL